MKVVVAIFCCTLLCSYLLNNSINSTIFLSFLCKFCNFKQLRPTESKEWCFTSASSLLLLPFLTDQPFLSCHDDKMLLRHAWAMHFDRLPPPLVQSKCQRDDTTSLRINFPEVSVTTTYFKKILRSQLAYCAIPIISIKLLSLE